MCVEAGYATAAVGRSWAGPGDHAGRAEMVLGRGRNPERVGTSQCSRQARQGGGKDRGASSASSKGTDSVRDNAYATVW